MSIIVLIMAILLRHAWQIYTTPGPDAILDVADGDPDDISNFMVRFLLKNSHHWSNSPQWLTSVLK